MSCVRITLLEGKESGQEGKKERDRKADSKYVREGGRERTLEKVRKPFALPLAVVLTALCGVVYCGAFRGAALLYSGRRGGAGGIWGGLDQ